ncbi:hypothetical protein BS47DRAFT_1365134 [Hydnum rufescens UP504]|uniref:Uncharacterized protein n=1 Tax=Hydnum rufescens UP504 TaxID=1448309 RepID=A0A9P6APT6_9AGAM|nr:hypothetical protein BS47DRAFT_1365134 [Hydnum rufescens UP504]
MAWLQTMLCFKNAHHPTYMNASPEYLERTMGPGSPLEALYLKGFQYLKRLDTLGAIAQSPFKDEMNVLEAYKTLRPALQRGHLKFEEWCSEVDGLEGKRCLSLALVHLATHMALDTIACLGGLESPNAVLMERLGMPCWGIMPRVVPQQLDFDAGGQPDADPLKEADFQRGMQALDSKMPDAYTIKETSEKLKGLLGSKVWSGRWYEDGSHMERQGRVWYQTRDIPLHLGAHNSVSESLTEVPLGYFHPELRFPLRYGPCPKGHGLCYIPQQAFHAPGYRTQPLVSPDRLSLPDPYGSEGPGEQYRPQGVLAFKGSLVLVKERA